MKKLFTLFKSPYLLLFISYLTVSSCEKDIVEAGTDWGLLQPTQADTSAGRWKTCILTSPDDIALVAPVGTGTPQYLAELQAVKTLQGQLTADQKSAMIYWGAGVTLRWNEIMRALVAKYNLPPQNNPDGSYPVPDQNNPFAYPAFPFSNPPYAARAYAYVSVAQYDALVTAVKYQNQYKRPAPHQVDASIQALLPVVQGYAYPCSEAVLATVTEELLKFLFPAEIDFIAKKAQEARQFRQWAGMASSSDIAAGDSIGKAVAAKVLARAKTDGMRQAVGTQAKWDSLANNRLVINEIPWKSLESPARPPMLPFYGNVRVWLIPSVATVRPAAPVGTASAEIKTQLAEIKNYVTNPTREQTAIVHFWADGVGTQTPPGHWNAIACDAMKNAQLSEVRTARHFALLNRAMMDAAISCWDTKSYYYYPRPSQLDPSIKTLTGVPNFPAYTSGHSTFSGAAATVLAHIFPNNQSQYNNMAKDASNSRLFGGIHYRMDCEVGLQVGQLIGQYAIQWARTDGAE